MKVYKCKDTKEVVIGYDAYLHTKHWKTKRRKIYLLRNKTCQMCKKVIKNGESYNVHHKNYNRVGNEKDSDLMLLCPECHKLLHKKQNDKESIISFVKRCLYGKPKNGNRKPTKARQSIENGDKSSTKNQKKSRKNY